MKPALLLLLCLPVFAQQDKAVRMVQLMESTAAAVPNLSAASQALRRQAEETAVVVKTPAGAYRFLNQVQAYLALSEAYLIPGIPTVAEQQFTELRDSLSQMRRGFEKSLADSAAAAAASAADPGNLHRYAEADSKLPPLGALPRVVFLGDSITDLWHLNEYFSGSDFMNRGISGQTTLQMLARFPQDVEAAHPRAVVVLGGINDIARGIQPQAIEDTLGMIGDLAKAHGIKAVFASLLPVSAEVAKQRPTAAILQVNLWLQDYCRREGFVYLDYFKALADANSLLPADLSDDGLHPNAKGYRVMAPIALEAVNKALEGTGTAPAAPRKRFGLPVIK